MGTAGSRVRVGMGQALGTSICKYTEKGKREPMGDALCPCHGESCRKGGGWQVWGWGTGLLFGGSHRRWNKPGVWSLSIKRGKKGDWKGVPSAAA